MVYPVQLIWSNNAQTTIANSISNTAITVNLASGTGAIFPNPGASQGFTGTFTDQGTGLLHEIVLVTGRAGDTITMQRGQEGTTPLNWTANDLFANLWTSGAAASLVQAYQLQNQSGNYAVDTGSVNAYIVGLTPAISSAPSAGTPIRVRITNSNTSASTLNAGWGAVAIVRRNGSALIGGELLSGRISSFLWNGSNFEWQGIAPATAAAITAGTDGQSAVTPAQLSNTSFAPSGTMVATAALTAPTGWVFCFGQAISRTTFSTLFALMTKSATVTLSIASPCVVTWASHGLSLGDFVSFETTGSLPTGLATATNYYAVPIDANTFQLCATPADVLSSTFINTTGSQTGTQTGRLNPFGCGNGTTTFNLPDARDCAIAGQGGMGGTTRGILGNNSSVGGFATEAMGNFAGQKAHAQTVPELVSHSHPLLNSSLSAAAGSGIALQSGNTTSIFTTSDTDVAGGGLALNVTQPTLLVNIIIKT